MKSVGFIVYYELVHGCQTKNSDAVEKLGLKLCLIECRKQV